MKNQSNFKAIIILSLLAAVVLPIPATAQAQQGGQGQPRGPRGVYGDWDLKVEFGDRDMPAILSFGRDEEGNLTADWISFWGVNTLKDVKFEDGKLSFVQEVKFRDQEFTQTFKGTIEEDKLEGVLSGERGDSEVEGKRSPRTPRAAGIWDLKYKVGDRDIESMLIIKQDKDGNLVGEWKNEQVESTVSDVNYQRGTITFKRKSKMGDREWESTFEGTIERQTGELKGTMKSDMGDAAVAGKRVGEPLIGTWNLDITADEREFKQRLRVNPDMSALYGTLPIEKVELKDGKVTFKAKWEFGDREFEMSFDGKLADDKLTGEITNTFGTQKVEGKKMERRFGRRPGGAGGGNR